MEDLTLTDYVKILKRWQALFAAVACVLLALSALFAMHWSTYRSTAVVQIEQPQISSNAMTPAGVNPRERIEDLADQRINQIQQKVLSTASLIEIITKFDLYPALRKHLPIAAVAERMSNKIKVELVNGTAASSGSDKNLSAIAFKLSYDYSNPLLTQQVTDELVTRFLDEDLKQKRIETHETTTFLDAQIAAMEKSMAEQEKKIADYQKSHGVSRPESLAFNQQAAQSATLSLQNLDSQITTNEGTLGSLRAQLAAIDPYSRVIADGQVMTTPTIQLKALQAQYATLSAQYGPEYPDVVKVRNQIEALQAQVGGRSTESVQLKAQITDVRTNLEAAQKTYGPDHPDVIALQNQLQQLQSQSAQQHHRPAKNDSGIIDDADNPAYLQTVVQLRAAEEQHKALIAQRGQLVREQQNYLKAINENPEAEKEMATLARDYDNAQLRYRELKEKKMSADMDEQMQRDRVGQRLTLINPPQLPMGTSPTRLILMMGGIIASLMGGLASVFLAQAIRQTIVGSHHLEIVVGAPPLVAIPHIRASFERQPLRHALDVLSSLLTHTFART